MARAFQKNSLHLQAQTGKKQSAHEVDIGSFIIEDDGAYHPWVTKKNKHPGEKGAEASELEAGFSELASLYMAPGLTPPVRIVKDGTGVYGLASEHCSAQVLRCMENNLQCYTLDTKAKRQAIELKSTPASLAERRTALQARGLADPTEAQVTQSLRQKLAQKGVHFLDKMGPDFFDTLMQEHHKGTLKIDMASLANVFGTSYTLEEDDLHKGNIGFYVTTSNPPKAGEIPKVTFFKIDHDLMFIDSIMSRKDARMANQFYNKDSFQISVRDLENFPDLNDSGNHYWPTSEAKSGIGDKAYKSKKERAAFQSLKNNADFNNTKWRCFLKHSLMPMDLISSSLAQQIDSRDDAAQIREAMVERTSKLTRALLESKQFADYLVTPHGLASLEEIQTEIATYMQQAGFSATEQEEFLSQISEKYRSLIDNLHNKSEVTKAVSLDFYSFDTDKKADFASIRIIHSKWMDCVNTQDSKGAYKNASILIDVIKKSDLNHDSIVGDTVSRFLASAVAYKERSLNAKLITSLQSFKEAADKIRNTDLPLRQKKMEILTVLKQSHLSTEALKDLKTELSQAEPDSPSLKFINKLRSQSWILRKIRGSYGSTHTSTDMVKEIDSQLSKMNATKTTGFYRKSIPHSTMEPPEGIAPTPSPTSRRG